jgi:pimeloyl-ACP methyl ester carboxylesterase
MCSKMTCMDFLYGFVPTLVFAAGILLAGLSLRRVLSLRGRSFATGRKILEGILLSLVALVALAIGLNSAVNAIILHHYRAQMPGGLYLVNGHRMRLDCTGSGSPTLVLDAGLGNDGLIFSAVQPALAATTRVCSYDRAGMGWSDPVPTPRDADQIAEQLHSLLQAAGIGGPIVAVGHSIAGMYIRDYASHYPAEVVGLVFIDASTPLQNRDPAIRREMRPGGPPLGVRVLWQAMFVLGITRWMGACSAPFPAFDPARAKLEAEARCHLVVSSPAGESTNFDRSGEETVNTGPYGSLPILIFTSDPAKAAKFHEPPDIRAAWDRMQDNLKKLSSRSRQIIAVNAGHYIQLERADLIDREVPLFIQQIRGTAPAPAVWGTTTRE